MQLGCLGCIRKLAPLKDALGFDVVDKTNAIVSIASFAPKTFKVRQDVSQIKNEFNFAIYTADAIAFDPDDAV